jgi:hypothetical protein
MLTKWRESWDAFRCSRFFPATGLVFILAAGAGLFAGAYTYAMGNPTPHRVPIAVVGDVEPLRRAAFIKGMTGEVETSVDQHPYRSYDEALRAVEEQQVYAILRLSQNVVQFDVVGAAGASVADLLSRAAPKAAARIGLPVTVRDLKPLQHADPHGLAIFYISLAANVVGFIGAVQLNTNASGLEPLERIAFIIAYALLGGFSIAAVVDWLLGALDLPFVESWLILALTMYTSGMVFTMFNTFLGRWAMLPTWLLMVILGNSFSGGAVSTPLLPEPLGSIGRWLPPGASVNAQHTAVYFYRHQHPLPFLMLGAWAAVSTAVFWHWRHRYPRGTQGRAVEQSP